MKYFSYLLLTITTLSCCSNVIAMTYYVDARNGNDRLSGSTPSVSGINGPWQSIARVNAATLQPGDQVLFSCGQTWYETLKPGSNGITSAKIYFGSYPSQCTDKPKISGFRSVLGYNWQLHQGNIWKTTFPQNLIINSNLSGSVANWVKWPSDASLSFIAKCPGSEGGCMSFLAGTTTNASIATSNPFPIVGGQSYAVTISFYAQGSTSTALIVRENGSSYRALGPYMGISGSGQWKDVTIQFTATQTIPNARLDIEVPKNKQIYVRYAQVWQRGALPKPSMVLFDGDPVNISHHPNAGHNTARPGSVYLRTAAASPTVTDSNSRQVSSQIVVPDLKLPSGGSVGPGTKLKLHNLDYQINDFSVTDVGTNTLSIAPNTAYPLSKAGWGFYFYDALWMLDSPGEWFFDNTTQTIYLWTPTNENPGNRVSVALMDTAIDFHNRSNLTVENLEIDGASTGVNIAESTNVTLRYLNIHNINDRAISAESSIYSTIANNYINRVGTGILAQYSTNPVIENNEVTEVGVNMKANKCISLPMRTAFGILTGSGTIISNNVLSDISGIAIWGSSDNDIDSNMIQRSCLSINDCSAIYIGPNSPRTVIKNNLILEVPGDIDGTPDRTGKIANGIYLDDGASKISVTGNTVKGSTNAIHIHNGGQNTITNNILYGSEDRLIWQQEDSMANGGIQGNIITNNQFFPTIQNSVAILSNTIFDNVDKFAAYDYNHYSTIHSPIIASERKLQDSMDYIFPDWQTAKTNNGIQRDNDFNGDTPAPLASFSTGIAGHNFMINGNFSEGLQGWGSWNATAPYASTTLEGCLPVSINCIHFIPGASLSVVHSPKFAITKGKFYRVTFDLKSTVDNVFVYSTIRLAGPNKYNDLMKDPPIFTSSTEWKRHSFVFEATDTAANPTINDQGARFDIAATEEVSMWIANLEIAPFDFGAIGPTQSDLLVNITDVDKTMDCPARLSNPLLCSSYVLFPEATVAVWPISVSPRSGRIVFTQNFTLLDSDEDGIANSQDECAHTVKGLAVNGRGCSLTD